MAPSGFCQSQAQTRVIRCDLFCICGLSTPSLIRCAHQLLGLDCRRVLFLQMSHQGFPLTQLRITQHRVLDYLVALVFDLQCGGVPIRLGRAHKVAQRRIVESGLSY